MNVSDDLRYPIGRMAVPDTPVGARQRDEWIQTIETLPRRLRHAVEGLTAEQWGTHYRPGGWTVRQVVHHLADSHMNAYVRVKLALTEEHPTIKPYDEIAWAALPDNEATKPEVSLALLEALHTRWAIVWRTMSPDDYQRTLVHPEHGRSFTLGHLLGQYAWHSDHHLRHITALGEREFGLGGQR